jgi:plastocyanin
MTRRGPLAALVAVLVAVVLAAAGCTIPTTKDGGGYGPSGAAAGSGDASKKAVWLRSGVTAKLAGKDFSWSTGRYLAKPGTAVVLDISNRDSTQHNFTLGGVNISKNIPADGRAEVRFTAPKPGRYRYWCKYHQEEMQGWLTVQ